MQVLMFCEEYVFIKVNPVCNPYPDRMEPGVHRYGYPPFFHFYNNDGTMYIYLCVAWLAAKLGGRNWTIE